MKECTTDLATYLNTSTVFKGCNLYEIKLLDGTVLYITDFDKDIVFNNHTYLHDKFILERSQTKVNGSPNVDTLNIVLYADRQHSDLVKNTFVLEAIHKGIFDTSQITLYRAYFDAEMDTNRPYGAIKIFLGRMELDSCDTFQAKFTAKAEITGLNALLPLRTFQAQTSYANNKGTVVEYSGDTTTCVVPLKPSSNVLYRF